MVVLWHEVVATNICGGIFVTNYYKFEAQRGDTLQLLCLPIASRRHHSPRWKKEYLLVLEKRKL